MNGEQQKKLYVEAHNSVFNNGNNNNKINIFQLLKLHPFY